MTQRELNRAVAAATGESLHTVAGLGFNLLEPIDDDFDGETLRMPLVVDWDAVDSERRAA